MPGDKQSRHRFLPLQQLVPQQSSEEDHAPLTIERGTEDPTTFFKVLPHVSFKLTFAATQDGKRKIDFVLVFEVIQLRFRLHRSSHRDNFHPKEDKKDAALCLLPKELEGTDIGVAAAAQAFK